ncbi:MAG TPA: hypothetical protein VGD08_01900 [Stellaceae bacterium]|jgi:hypothetical protein
MQLTSNAPLLPKEQRGHRWRLYWIGGIAGRHHIASTSIRLNFLFGTQFLFLVRNSYFSDHDLHHLPLSLQQLAKQLLGGCRVPAAPDDNIERDALRACHVCWPR